MKFIKVCTILELFVFVAICTLGEAASRPDEGKRDTVIINDDFESTAGTWKCVYKKDIDNGAMKITSDFHYGDGNQALSITSSGKHVCFSRTINLELAAGDTIAFDFYWTGEAIPLSLILTLQDMNDKVFVCHPLYKNISPNNWLHVEIPLKKINGFHKSKIKNICLGATPIEEDRDKTLSFIIDNFKIIHSKQDNPAFVKNDRPLIAAFKISPAETEEQLFKCDMKKTGGIDSFMTPDTGLAKHRTSVAVMYDDKNLYIKFKCYDNEPRNILKKYTAHDDPVYLDDALEVFIAPGGGNSNYYQFIVNSTGTRAETKGITDYLTKEYDTNRLDWTWNADWNARVEIKNDSWNGAISIPMESIGMKTVENARISICRDYRGGKEGSSLFVKGMDWHNPKEWGELVFIDGKTPLQFFRLEHIGESGNLNFSFESKAVAPGLKAQIGFLYPGTNTVAENLYISEIGTERNFSIPYSLEEKKTELIFSLKDGEKTIFRNLFPLPFTKDGFVHNAQVVHDEKGSIIWIENPSFKILPQDKINKTSFSKEVEISLAKNEHEPFQVVITPSSELLNKEISFEVSDLTGEGDNTGKIISRKDISWHPEYYVNIKSACPTRPDSFAGQWPDALLPARAFKLNSLHHQPFWFSIYSRKDTVPGTYKGNIKVLVDGKKYSEFILKVKIWGFTLPDISYMKTMAIYDQADKCGISNHKFLENIKKHKMSPGRIFNPADFEAIYGYDSNFIVCFTPSLFGVGDWDRRRKFMFNIDGHEKDIYSSEFKNHWMKLIKEKCGDLKKKNILDKFYFWIWDEPWYAADPALMEKIVSLSKMVREAEPGLKIVTGGNERMGDKALDGLVDAWITDLYIGGGCYEYEMAKRLKAKGQETWCYHNALYLINVQGIYPRLLAYILLKYDIDCYIFWHISKWCDWKTGSYYPDLYRELENNTIRYGDGLLLYYDDNRIINSLRWELLRDSFEDYDYYCILKQKLADAEKNKKLSEDKIKTARELLEYPDKLIKTYRSLNHITQEDIYSKRNEIGEFIDRNLR